MEGTKGEHEYKGYREYLEALSRENMGSETYKENNEKEGSASESPTRGWAGGGDKDPKWMGWIRTKNKHITKKKREYKRRRWEG